MDNRFFERPVINSPYKYPSQHWELDDQGQPTQRIIEKRRSAKFITPIPKPRKQKTKETPQQQKFIFDEGKGLSTKEQQYDPTPIINALRREVNQWRSLKNSNDWKVTPETARLLQHWRHHKFSNIRPFFCQVEAVETAIWLTEVAPNSGKNGKFFLEHLANANNDANPELMRLALKLATGAGNFDEHGNPLGRPNTILIDSEQLESGDALDKNFRDMAIDEIERFRREIIERTGDRRQAENINDQDLLREVMKEF